MALRRPRYNCAVFHLSLIVVSLFVAVMPPGLCPCWLMRDVRALHPHPGGFPERPHRHDYLFEIFQSQPAIAVEQVTNPVGRLIEHLLNNSVWLSGQALTVYVPGWRAAPPTPPPRFS